MFAWISRTEHGRADISRRTDGVDSGFLPKRPRLVWYLWLLMLIVIPITSFPPIARLLGGIVVVSPLSMLPMIFIILLYVLPKLLRGGRVTGLSWPIIFFLFSAFVSALAAFLLPILPFKGQTVFNRELRAGMTLVIGLGFYFSALMLPGEKEEFLSSLRAIYVGFMLLALWSTVQAYFSVASNGVIPAWVTKVHRLFSVRDPFSDRLTGLAYEPSWYGDQLVILYMPLLISSVATGISAFRRFSRWVTVEHVLLLASIMFLVLTKSRISLLSFSAMAGGLIILTGFRKVRAWIGRLKPFSDGLLKGSRLMLSAVSLVLLIAGGTLAGLILLWGMTKLDPRLSGLFELSSRVGELRYYYPQDVLYALGGKISLAERFIYWSAAFRIFGTYPLLGVGPGNAGFLFEKFMPAYGSQLVEIQNLLNNPIYGFPNPKSLWLRILAEQGIIGMMPFLLWFALLGMGAWALMKSNDRFDRLMGRAGMLCLVAEIFEGFSLDTYALPHLWIMLGLLSAWVGRRLLLNQTKDQSINGLAEAHPSPTG